MSAKILETKAAVYELEVPMDAPANRVWRALTEETTVWWLPDFHMVGPDSTVTLDARAGGHLIEQCADGGSLLWYTVLMCTPGESLYLVGHVAPEYGGPSTSMLTLTLVKREGGCTLRVQDALNGHFSPENIACLEDGWGQLFRDGLKRHVEGT